MAKKVFREKLSFNAADVLQRNSLSIDKAGLSMVLPSDFESFVKDFEGYSREKLSFGMLGNDPKYYGQSSDVAPKAEDFVEVPFRLISATIVGAGSWKCTDFSNVNVLKASRNLLDGKTVYKDHETDTDNWVGLVNGIKWSEAFNSNGTKVPAGIDGIIAIDKVTNPKVARGALMGSIYSNSVTVEFDWEMSHPFDKEWDFVDKIGQLGADGKMVRRVVTAIHNYHETSLVWLGADPFAKAYDSAGALKNIDIGSVLAYTKAKPEESEMSADARASYEVSKKYAIDLGFDKNLLPLSKKNVYLPKENQFAMNEKFIIAFIAAFGTALNLKKEDLLAMKSEEELVAKMESFKLPSVDPADALALTAVKDLALAVVAKETPDTKTVDLVEFAKTHVFVPATTLTSLEAAAAKVESLETEKVSLEKEAVAGRTYLSAKRTEAVRLYKATVGEDKADAAVVALFNSAEDSAVEGLLKQYTKDATMKFGGKCADCGSGNFEFKSSFEAPIVEPVVGEVVDFKALKDAISPASINIKKAE